MAFKIAIDAGHGPNTPGKRSPDGMREYEFNRAVAYAMRDELKNYEGVELMFTFSDSQDVPLSTRSTRANSWGADVFVSIHANAAAGKMGNHGGIETYVYGTAGHSLKLANVVQRKLVAVCGLRNRGVKVANFQVLRQTKMPAILIEHGFMDSYTDLPKLKSGEFRELCGVTNAHAVAEYFGLKRKATIADDKAAKEKAVREKAAKEKAERERKEKAEQAKREQERKAKEMADNKKATGFTDIPADHRIAEAVKYLKAEGIFSGYADGSFRPDEPLTRAEVAIALHRVMTKE